MPSSSNNEYLIVAGKRFFCHNGGMSGFGDVSRLVKDKVSSVIFEESMGNTGGYVGDKYIESKDDPRVLVTREAVAGVLNITLFMAEAIRNAYHDGSIKLEKTIPLQTEGALGFVDQHVGNSLETVAAIYAYRFPIEGVARIIEGMTGKKVNPHAKMALAIFLGTATTMWGEFQGGNSGYADWFGCFLAGLWASGSWAVGYQLSKPRESNYFDVLADKANLEYEKLKGAGQAVSNNLTSVMEWSSGLFMYGEKTFDDILNNTRHWVDDFSMAIPRMGDYLELESRVSILMLDDFIKRQQRRWEKVGKGEEDSDV